MNYANSIIVRLLGDASDYVRMWLDAERQTNKSIGQIQNSLGSANSHLGALQRITQGVGQELVALTGILGGIGAVAKSIKLSADFETMGIAFQALTGSASTAKTTIAQLTDFAAKTPFNIPQVNEAAKQMLAYGTEAKNIIPTMTIIGDVASALNIPLSQMAYLYGTLQAQGRVYTRDLMQFAMRGIPIFKQLELQLGKTNAEIRDMTEKGQITFTTIEKAFAATTGPMGRFHGLMEKVSHGLEGLASNFQDRMIIAMKEMGDELVKYGGIKEKIEGATAAMGAFVIMFKEAPESLKAGAVYLGEWVIATQALMLAFGALPKLFNIAWAAIVGPITKLMNILFVAGPMGMGMFFSAGAILAAKLAAVLGVVAAAAYAIYGAFKGAYALADRFTGTNLDVDPNKIPTHGQGSANYVQQQLFKSDNSRVGGQIERAGFGSKKEAYDNTKMGLEDAQTNLKGMERNADEAAKKLEKVNTWWNRSFSGGQIENAKAELDDMNKHVEHGKEVVEKWKDAFKKVDFSIDPAEVDKFMKGLETRVKNFGKSGDRIEMDRLFGEGNDPKNYEKAKELLKQESAMKATADINALNEKLGLAMSTTKMTGNEIEIFKAKLHGASEASIALAKALNAQNEAMERRNQIAKEVKDLGFQLRGETLRQNELGKYMQGDFTPMQSDAARNRQLDLEKKKAAGFSDKELAPLKAKYAKADEMEKFGKALEEGRKITEDFLEPQQKLAMQQEKLQDLFDRGAISSDTYTKAMAQARNEIMATDRSIQRIEGSLVGSADAMAKLDEFRAGKTAQNIGGPRLGQGKVRPIEGAAEAKVSDDPMKLMQDYLKIIADDVVKKANANLVNPIIKLVQGAGF